ncbi:MAG: exo-alpha-sialidase, partial [Verrucomicrobia bacterium]
MIEVANGSWLAVTTRYPPGTNSHLRLSRSTDQARSWTTLAEVREPGRTLDNGELVRLPDGVLLLTMRSLIPNDSYRLPVYASTDGGRTWTFRSLIDANEGPSARQGRGLWEPDFWVLDDGRLVVTYSNETHDGYSQLISLRVSTDGGLTWGPEQWAVAPPAGSNLRPGMSQMTRMANGEYLLVYEVVNSGRADVHAKVSPDGVHWPEGLGARIPCQHCGPFVTALSNGLVLVTSCENEISFSEDFGRTWQRIDPPAWPLGFAHTWPAIYQTRPDEVAVMAVNNGVRLRFGSLT